IGRLRLVAFVNVLVVGRTWENSARQNAFEPEWLDLLQVDARDGGRRLGKARAERSHEEYQAKRDQAHWLRVSWLLQLFIYCPRAAVTSHKYASGPRGFPTAYKRRLRQTGP